MQSTGHGHPHDPTRVPQSRYGVLATTLLYHTYDTKT